MESDNFYKAIETDLKSSYSKQKSFTDQLFNDIHLYSDTDIHKVLQTLFHLIENLEFPFVLFLNRPDYMDKFGGIFHDRDFSIFIEGTIKACVKKLDFQNKNYSSIESILTFAEIMGTDTNYEQRVRDLSHLEQTYLEYCNLLIDCQFLKSYLHDNPNEIDINEVVLRIKKTVNERLNFTGMNYPIYVFEFAQELIKMLTEYENFFASLCVKSKGYENINTTYPINKKPEIDLDPKHRTFFYLQERIQVDEGMSIEYKNYGWRFSVELVESLKNQICGFLNAQGGRIYIGISDDKVVKGILLKPKDRDIIRNEIANYTTDFYPKCRTNKIGIFFVPLKNIQDDQFIANSWVIKIIIKQGDVDKLYSYTSKGFFSFIRMPGQCVSLSAEEITEEILKRKTNPRNQIDEKEFFDTEPEMPLDPEDNNIGIDSVFSNFKKNNNRKRSEVVNKDKSNFNQVSTVFVQKIPPITDRISVLNIFKDCKYVSEKVVVEEDGCCKGWAYFNFKSESDAKNALIITKGATLNGVKLLINLKK